MDESTEVLEQQIDETKASLMVKLEALETHVADAVQATTDTVSETVDAVRDTVNTVKEKVQDAGEYLNLRRQAEKNPWTVLGSSIVAGCVAGYLIGKKRRAGGATGAVEIEAARPVQPAEVVVPRAAASPQPEKHGWLHEQMGNLSGLAIGALMGALRDVAVGNLPDGFGKSVSEEIDRLTTSLGAKPIEGPILPQLQEWLGHKEKPAEMPPPARPAAATSAWPPIRAPKQPAI